jgi:nucleoside-diphosphate-sugar epimerase
MTTRTAIVTGGSGTVGFRLAAELARSGTWRVISLTRRGSEGLPASLPRVEHLKADLLDRDASVVALKELRGVTHIFSAARHDFTTGTQESAEANTIMLANLLDAARATGQPLEHVHIVQGTKYYGSNLGPFPTPAKESAPRALQGNFYYDQQDLVTARSAAEGWHWSASRPHAIVDSQRALPRSMPTIIAVYAVLSRELGLPLCFPGTPENYRALYQFTEASLLSRAIAWMATESTAADKAFNITNGDCIRWCNVWPAIARYFRMECGPVRTVRLAQVMADKAAVWQRIVDRNCLRPTPYDELALWTYGDFVLTPSWDHLLSMNRAREHGFHDFVDTERMIFGMLDRLREWRIIPPD